MLLNYWCLSERWIIVKVMGNERTIKHPKTLFGSLIIKKQSVYLKCCSNLNVVNPIEWDSVIIYPLSCHSKLICPFFLVEHKKDHYQNVKSFPYNENAGWSQAVKFCCNFACFISKEPIRSGFEPGSLCMVNENSILSCIYICNW